jgi:hypothetical protein
MPLYISEHEVMGAQHGGLVQAVRQPPLAEQTVAVGGASVQSSAFNARTQVVRVHTNVVCSIKFGTDPTATTSTARMAAGQTEYFAVPQGASYKVAAISNT